MRSTVRFDGRFAAGTILYLPMAYLDNQSLEVLETYTHDTILITGAYATKVGPEINSYFISLYPGSEVHLALTKNPPSLKA